MTMLNWLKLWHVKHRLKKNLVKLKLQLQRIKKLCLKTMMLQ